MAISTGKVVALIQAMGSSADPAVIESAVQDWLDNHPEATTTVQDGSITEQKLASAVAAKLAEVTGLKSAINVLEPAATSGDVGKTLVVKTVENGKVTEYEFGETGGGNAELYSVNRHNVLDWNAEGVLENKGYYDNNNDKTITINGAFISDFIPVAYGETYAFCYLNNIRWYTADKTFLLAGNTDNGNKKHILIAVPENAGYVRVQTTNKKDQAYLYKYVGNFYDYSAYSENLVSYYATTDDKIIKGLSKDIESGLSNGYIDFGKMADDSIPMNAIDGLVPFYWNIVDNSKNKIGVAIDNNGSEYYYGDPGTTEFVTTDFCAVKPGETYMGQNGGIFGYNASKEFVATVPVSSYVFTIPSDVYYIKVSVLVTTATFSGFNILKNGYGKTFKYNSVYSHEHFFPMFNTEDSKNGFKLYLDLEPWKDKRICVIGDSFSAPGIWQTQMCANLYAISDNHSISGGGWCNGRSKTVYELAQEVTTRPDIVIICMGTNDVNDNNITLGEFVEGTSVLDYSDTTWIGGIQKALTYIRNQWTGVPVFVGYTPGGVLYNAGKWARQKEFIEALKELCILYSCVYIETRTCGKAYPLVQNDLVFNTSASDGHPSGEGQAQIARYMTDLMSGFKSSRSWYTPN